MTSLPRPCAHVPSALDRAFTIRACAIGAFASCAGLAQAGVTLLDFSWTSAAESTQVAHAVCEDTCPGGFGICTATVTSFSDSGAAMTDVNRTNVAGRHCVNSCGDSLYASANSGVGATVVIKTPLVAGETQLWSFAHSVTVGAEAELLDNGCGVGSALATASGHQDWHLAFRVDAPTEMTMTYSHATMRDRTGAGPSSNWTIRRDDGTAIFEQHLGGPFSLPPVQETLVWYLNPGDYTMELLVDVEGATEGGGTSSNHSASASCELIFRPSSCARIVAQTNDQTICPIDDLSLGVILDQPLLPRTFQWQMQSRVAPFVWADVADGALLVAQGDQIVQVGDAFGATNGAFAIDLDPQFADALSGAIFRCVVTDDCGLHVSRPIAVTVNDGFCACPPCAADYDRDGGVNGADISAFFSDWSAGETCADVDLDGGITGGDLGSFFAVFEQGGC